MEGDGPHSESPLEGDGINRDRRGLGLRVPFLVDDLDAAKASKVIGIETDCSGVRVFFEPRIWPFRTNRSLKLIFFCGGRLPPSRPMTAPQPTVRETMIRTRVGRPAAKFNRVHTLHA